MNEDSGDDFSDVMHEAREEEHENEMAALDWLDASGNRKEVSC